MRCLWGFTLTLTCFSRARLDDQKVDGFPPHNSTAWREGLREGFCVLWCRKAKASTLSGVIILWVKGARNELTCRNSLCRIPPKSLGQSLWS